MEAILEHLEGGHVEWCPRSSLVPAKESPWSIVPITSGGRTESIVLSAIDI